MATANTILKRMSAVSGLGFRGEPMTFHGYLATSTAFNSGDLLISASGALGVSGHDPVEDTIIGVLCPLAATPPALGAQVNSERTTSATAADRTKYDDDKSVVFWPWLPGQIMSAHLIENEAAFVDERAEVAQNYANVGISFDAANGLNGIFVFTLAANITNNEAAFQLGFVNPQLTTVDAAGALIQRPGPIVFSATVGTLNPVVIANPKCGALFTGTTP